MEDPGFHWERDKTSVDLPDNTSPQEAARYTYQFDSNFDLESLTYWGWMMGYADASGGVTPLRPETRK